MTIIWTNVVVTVIRSEMSFNEFFNAFVKDGLAFAALSKIIGYCISGHQDRRGESQAIQYPPLATAAAVFPFSVKLSVAPLGGTARHCEHSPLRVTARYRAVSLANAAL